MAETTDEYVARRTANLPTVLTTPPELLRVIEGHPVVLRLTDPNTAEGVPGREVVVRLATAEEFKAEHEAACKSLNVPPNLTDAQAAAIVKPVVFPS